MTGIAISKRNIVKIYDRINSVIEMRENV